MTSGGTTADASCTIETPASSSHDDPGRTDDVRARVVAAAAQLIATGGREAATTRAVAVAAGVQAPTIYRLFGDKHGLLDAVAEHELAAYMADKAARPPHADPLQDLRDGWDQHVAFCLANPGLFEIMIADPRPHPGSTAADAGMEVLRRRVRRLAAAGRLRTSEARAVALVVSMGNGTVLTLLAQPAAERDPDLSRAAREAVLDAITGAPAVDAPGPGGAAAALRAALDQTAALTAGERLLLGELLDRIADAG